MHIEGLTRLIKYSDLVKQDPIERIFTQDEIQTDTGKAVSAWTSKLVNELTGMNDGATQKMNGQGYLELGKNQFDMRYSIYQFPSGVDDREHYLVAGVAKDRDVTMLSVQDVEQFNLVGSHNRSHKQVFGFENDINLETVILVRSTETGLYDAFYLVAEASHIHLAEQGGSSRVYTRHTQESTDYVDGSVPLTPSAILQTLDRGHGNNRNDNTRTLRRILNGNPRVGMKNIIKRISRHDQGVFT